MKKLHEIRDHLAAKVPCLKKDPDRLDVYIEKGAIACGYGSLSFEYRYEAKILVKDYADHADTLIMPLLAWIGTNQPNLLLDADKSDSVIGFEAEIVDHGRTDILLTIAGISERVIVREEDGRYIATHCEEPTLPDLGGPTGWSLHNGTDVES